MRKVILIPVLLLLFYEMAFAGILSGRIIDENGNSLANKVIEIEGKITKTNAFGVFSINIRDGKRKLEVKISGKVYQSDEITIYSPATAQNWRLDSKNNRLILIR